jgi:hypothetical protein
MRGRCRWTRPTVVTELILMEIGDLFMARKWLLGVQQQAERLGAQQRRPIAGPAAARGTAEETSPAEIRRRQLTSPVAVEAEVDISRPPRRSLTVAATTATSRSGIR